MRSRHARVSRAERRGRKAAAVTADRVFAHLERIANTPSDSDAHILAESSLRDIARTGTLKIGVWCKCTALRSVTDGIVHEIPPLDPGNEADFVMYALTELVRWRRLEDVRECDNCEVLFLRDRHRKVYCSPACRLEAKREQDVARYASPFGAR